MNTELRRKATSDFEKDLYKLMNNSVFGKTMENKRKRVDIRLIRSHEKERLGKQIASPSYAGFTLFDSDFAAIEVCKSKLVRNKPVDVGMSILDSSNHLMHDFFYNNIKKQYGENCSLLYTDTDSLLLEIQTEDVYRDMKENITDYDTSDYPRDHYLHSMDFRR